MRYWPMLLIVFLAGCAVLPTATGPIYYLEPMAPPEEQPPIEVTFHDRRPEWEKQYRVAAADPERYSDAIGFIPCENFRPSIREQLRRTVQRAAAELDKPPASGAIKLRHFRVVLNNTDKMKARYEEIQQNEERRERRKRDRCRRLRRMGLHEEFERECEETLLGSIMSDLLSELWEFDFDERRRLRGAMAGDRVLIGPPEQLPAQYGPAVTCEIEATITFQWPDGKQHTMDILATDFSYPRQRSIQNLHDVSGQVQQAIQNLKLHLVKRANGKLAADLEQGQDRILATTLTDAQD